MKFILFLLFLIPATTNAQKFGVTPYFGIGYSQPRGQYIELGAATTYSNKQAVGGVRASISYNRDKYKAGALDTIPHKYNAYPGTDYWSATSLRYSLMVDLMPKYSGKFNLSFAFGGAAVTTNTRAYYRNGNKDVIVNSGTTFYPKAGIGAGFSAFICNFELYIPTDYPVKYAPFQFGLTVYPKLLFPKKQTTE